LVPVDRRAWLCRSGGRFTVDGPPPRLVPLRWRLRCRFTNRSHYGTTAEPSATQAVLRGTNCYWWQLCACLRSDCSGAALVRPPQRQAGDVARAVALVQTCVFGQRTMPRLPDLTAGCGIVMPGWCRTGAGWCAFPRWWTCRQFFLILPWLVAGMMAAILFVPLTYAKILPDGDTGRDGVRR